MADPLERGPAQRLEPRRARSAKAPAARSAAMTDEPRDDAPMIQVSQRHPAHCFSAVLRPFCAVFPPFFCAVRLPGAETERTGEKWRKMGEIWGRNGRETAVAEWRWGQLAVHIMVVSTHSVFSTVTIAIKV